MLHCTRLGVSRIQTVKNICVWLFLVIIYLGPVVQEMYSIFSSSGQFVQWSRTTCAILNREIWGTVVEKYSEFGLMVQEMWFNVISIFSAGGLFVLQNITVCAILVEGIMRNISVRIF